MVLTGAGVVAGLGVVTGAGRVVSWGTGRESETTEKKNRNYLRFYQSASTPRTVGVGLFLRYTNMLLSV